MSEGVTDKPEIVASFTDAWIETSVVIHRLYVFLVASFTDAWIETKARIMKARKREVASFTDAWIETFSFGSETSSA